MNEFDIRNKILDIVEANKASLSISQIVRVMAKQGVGERPVRESIQYLIDQGPLKLNSKFNLQLKS